ncbi:PREDICTED: uncharacterized protein LOC109159652 [Ipomoea nil]|uniref:uncharacterized protein LOC109159652 n=1 Tax=Ipomoea nil TaxID=35883 RepID=UPI0009018CFE|nr:PREDICTED: uncharacterized protein LOC109159652 [Ipomoea nil]
MGEASQPSQPRMNQPPINAPPIVAPQRNQTEDVENPLYLNSNENPNTILISPPLNGSSNYASWSIAMQVALEVKNKWFLIDGSLPAPDRTQNNYQAWRRCNLMVKSWILKTVHPSIAQSVMYMEAAKDVWNDFRKRFSQRDAHRISTLQNEIYNLRQGSLSVNEYYTKCRTFWEEIKDREIDEIIRFLQGLGDDYNPLKSNILVLDPLPEMYKVFVMTEKFERQLNITSSNLQFNLANAVHNELSSNDENSVAAVNYYNGKRNMNSGNGNRNAKCTYCGMTGHTVEKCYKKHGYPPGWIPGFKSKGKQPAMAASASSDNAATSEQLQKLISLLQIQVDQHQTPTTADAVSLIPNLTEHGAQAEGKSYFTSHINSLNLCDSTWILDSGATDHIVCSREFFNNCCEVKGATVNLPNGERVVVQHKGDIKLAEDLWLKNVLHIPDFRFNIVSVSRLLQDSSHILLFNSGQCLLQKAGMTSGFAREEDGLYLLCQHQRSIPTATL